MLKKTYMQLGARLLFMKARKSLLTSAIGFMLILSISELFVSTHVAFNGQFRLKPLIGAVYSQNMVPITGAMVVASGSNGTGFSTTDSYGRYQIAEGLGTGEYSVTVTAKGYIDLRIEKVQVVAGEETSGINFLLKQSGAISGKVTGAGNKPLKGVLVYAMQTTGTGGNASSYALTGEDGSYVINTGLSTGKYNVTAGWYALGLLGETVGYIAKSKSDVKVVEVEETSDVNFQLEISGAISGKVTTTEGIPLLGLMVVATSSDGKYFGFGYTDGSGNYKITNGLGTGSYNVLVFKGMMPSFKSDVSVTAGEETPNIDFEISIPLSGTISGRVTDIRGNPVKDASVHASGPEGHGQAKTDVNGYYAISEGLGTGDYTVYATALGYDPSSSIAVGVTVNQETKGIDFQLEKISAIVSGKISGEVKGAPTAIGPEALSVTVSANPSTIGSGGTSTIEISVKSNGTPIPASTVTLTSDRGGVFSEVTDHGDGTYTVIFTAPSVAASTPCMITASVSKAGYTSGSGQGEVALEPLLALAVTVTTSPATIYSGGESTITVSVASQGTVITGAAISLTSDKGGAFSMVTDRADGTYEATFTAPDITAETICTLATTASKSGYLSSSGQTDVMVQPLILNIYVKDTDGNPIAGATVSSTSQPSGQTALSGTTDVNGLVRFSGVLKGSYTITASKTGYEEKTWTVTVTAGQATTETINISKPTEPTKFPWVLVITAIVAVLIIVGAVGAVFMMRKRTRKA